MARLFRGIALLGILVTVTQSVVAYPIDTEPSPAVKVIVNKILGLLF